MAFLETIGGAALIGGVGALLGNEQRRGYASDAMRHSARQAQLQMDFQERMSNTAIQRRMADMRAAGINPILAGKYDASTPGGAMGQAYMPQIDNIGSEMVNSAKTGGETAILNEQLKPLIDQMGTVAVDAALKNAQKALARLDADHRESAIAILEQELKIKKRFAEVSDTDFAKWMSFLGEFTGAIGNVFRGSASHHF